jgi:soluble lytic murein transglycosylase-like protein
MLHSAYERRGQHDRHRARVRHMAAAVGVAAVVAVLVAARNTPEAHAAGRAMSDASPASIFGFGSQHIKEELDATKGQLDLANAQLERLNAVVHFSGQYHIGADLAASVYDIAVAEGIEPELGFRLVKAESDFNEHATSSAGALGLTQMMPATAQFFVPGVSHDALYQRETNLRVGFRYLRTLVRENHGDLNLALLVYNRGEGAVDMSVAQGRNPSNGYEREVTRGYKGTGVIN